MKESAMKFCCGCNHCGERGKTINDEVSSDKHVRCSEKETWDHVVQCRNTVSMRAEFVLEWCKELKKVQAEGSSDEEVRSSTEEARKCLREDRECLEMSQQATGMNHLFRRFQVKA